MKTKRRRRGKQRERGERAKPWRPPKKREERENKRKEERARRKTSPGGNPEARGRGGKNRKMLRESTGEYERSREKFGEPLGYR
eukprot:scaffold209325_cov26-Tisochrysis_lutea.AAC.2